MSTIAVRVDAVTQETPDIRSLRLVSLDGSDLGPYRAGAHIDVHGPTGIVRQYSLCNPPADPASLTIAVKLEPTSRGGSKALHEVEAGDELAISAPRNILELEQDADLHLLLAGGIGVTPLLSMAHELLGRGEHFRLHYFGRSEQEMAFLRLLRDGDLREHVVVHAGLAPDEVASTLGALRSDLTEASAVYTCGPSPFMEAVSATLGPVVGAARVHIETFTATEIDTSGDLPFVVELDSGESFDIPADRSILSVLEENGIEVFKSCEEGICGSCVSGVLEGVPEHRDNCLSQADKAANDQMALCVSRARTSRLVIELY